MEVYFVEGNPYEEDSSGGCDQSMWDSEQKAIDEVNRLITLPDSDYKDIWPQPVGSGWPPNVIHVYHEGYGDCVLTISKFEVK